MVEDKRITVVIDGDKAKDMVELQTILMKKDPTKQVSFGKVMSICLEKGIEHALKEARKP